MRPALFLVTFCALSLILVRTHAQESRLSANVADQDLNLQRSHVAWPEPGKLAEELISKDDSVRLRAILLIGLADEDAHVSYQSSGTERQTIRPDLVRLNYAALGEGPDLQAVLAFQAEDQVFVAVATPTKAGWVRIAYASMWSKYDLATGDALFENVRLSSDPDSNMTIFPAKFELVLRSSGGGSGIYVQQEAHYRVFEGELRNVFSFESAQRSCPPSGRVSICTLKKSWLVDQVNNEGKRGVMLVDERGSFPTAKQPDIFYSIRDLNERYLRISSCAFYTWDNHTFDYKLNSGHPKTCRARRTK